MKLAAPFYLLKFAQIIIIVIILWRIFSECRMCGRFVQTKDVLRHGIDGTCRRLFFYLPPNAEEDVENPTPLKRLPHLRLWWSFDGEKFLPPKPEKEELSKIAKQIKEEIATSAKWLGVDGGEGEGDRVERNANTKWEEEEESTSEFSLVKKTAILPEEEEKPAEILELDKYSREADLNETVPVVVEKVDGNNIVVAPRRKTRRKRENGQLPWLEMQKSALLPHEESKKRNFVASPMNYQQQQMERGMGNGPSQRNSALMDVDENSLGCFQLRMQEYAANMETTGWLASPLVTLGNRSVATVAVGFSHLLLLFAQVYLLNCLEVDNLEQRRGKLFLELLVILLGSLGWLVVFLLKIRTELSWETIWMCTNFRPEIFKMIIFVQVFAGALLLLGIFEGIYIYLKMRKCHKMIEVERENDMKPQRPPI